MRQVLRLYELRFALCAVFLSSPLFIASRASAVEFTTNAWITSSQYAGEAIIVTGCTLTID